MTAAQMGELLADMTTANVRKAVLEIELLQDDDEQAHAREDQLHQAVLAAIAEGHPHARALAATALETQAFQFSRWCA